MARQLRFSVEAQTNEVDKIYVSGRVRGDSVRVGDCFERTLGELGHERPVSLIVRAILTYRKYVNQVDRGMTAELELEAKDRELLSVGEVLIGQSDEPPYPEHEILGEGDFHTPAI